MFRIISLSPREDFPFREDLIIFGFNIEPDDFSQVDEIELASKIFKVRYNREYDIWTNIPLFLGHRNYVNSKSAIIFKFVRPFIVRKGETLNFLPESLTFNGNLLLYVIPPKDVESPSLKQATKTRLIGHFIDIDRISDTILFEEPVKISSIGFAIPRIVNNIERWLKVYNPGNNNVLSGNLEYDIRAKLRLSSGVAILQDREFRAIKSFAGDLQDNLRLVIKGLHTAPNENLQIALEKSIDTLNANRVNKYGRLFILVEYAKL